MFEKLFRSIVTLRPPTTATPIRPLPEQEESWTQTPSAQSPHVETAHELLNYALAPENQAKLLELKTYGPVLSAATEGADAETAKILVMTPDNIKDMVILNEEEANKYSREYEEQWNQLMLG